MDEEIEVRRLKMSEKINESRRNFVKAAGLTGAALMVGLKESIADAGSIGPGVIGRGEIT